MTNPSSKKPTKKPTEKPTNKPMPKRRPAKTSSVPQDTKIARARRSQVLAQKTARELTSRGIGPNSEQFKGGTISQGAFAPYVISG